MREINIDDLISKNYQENQINKLQPKKILARSLCTKIQSSLKNEYNRNELREEPTKKYEIYKITINKKEEIFIADTNYLPNNNKDNQELYFDKNIAFEIQKILISINDSAINSCPEIMELYQNEFLKKQNELEELRKLDELKFEKSVKRYNLIKVGVLKNRENDYDKILKENKYLQEELKKYKKYNNQLTKMLKISLEKYEELKNKKMNFLNKFSLKLNKI